MVELSSSLFIQHPSQAAPGIFRRFIAELNQTHLAIVFITRTPHQMEKRLLVASYRDSPQMCGLIGPIRAMPSGANQP
jgi:hypothetical protein